MKKGLGEVVKKVINILGPMGVGKSTIGEGLEKITGFNLILESFIENPYWADSISGRNPQHYKMQIEFMTQYINNLALVRDSSESYILDAQFISGLAFTMFQRKLGLVNEVDFDSYQRRFDALAKLMAPDLKNIKHFLLVDEPINVYNRVHEREREEEAQTSLRDIELICEYFNKMPEYVGELVGLDIEVVSVSGLAKGEIPRQILDYVNASEVQDAIAC